MPRRALSPSVLAERHASRNRERLARETSEQRDARNARRRELYHQRRAAEREQSCEDAERSESDRDVQDGYRARRSDQHRARIDAETPEERASRLARARQRRVERQHEYDEQFPAPSDPELGMNLNLAAFSYNSRFDYLNHPHNSIGDMSVVCRECLALRFPREPPGICCFNGKVRVPEFESPPQPLDHLLSYSTSTSRKFIDEIRKYNSCFQMTSFGATGPIENYGWAPTIRIQGQIYHKIGGLLPRFGENPSFIQVYFIDSQIQTDIRCALFNSGTERRIIVELQGMLFGENNLIRQCKIGLERMPSDDHRLVIRSDCVPSGEHAGRYNCPRRNDIAIIIVEPNGEVDNRQIVIDCRTQGLKFISELDPLYDAFQYPLMFPRGESTYHIDLRMYKDSQTVDPNKRLSITKYYSYILMMRQGKDNHLLRFGTLLSQFLCDMYAKAEASRLRFIRLNQAKLRADEYIHLRDAVSNDYNVNNLGELCILPSSFIGSPRHMHEYVQDSLTYVRKFGRPDLFITFTCNPNWPEIKRNLLPDQSAIHRHDIVARVFRQKLIVCIDLIVKSSIFGFVRAFVYNIEWQKRGLPHAHMLFWMRERIRPDQIDHIISAEIPNPETDPQLFEIVTKNMIHGPCFPFDSDQPCLDGNKCTKRFPRCFNNETQTDRDGYPLYRRRSVSDGGQSFSRDIKGQRVNIDNRWVVPYCPVLSRFLVAHVNVESCSSVSAVKYICKYIHKGSDMAVFNVQGLSNFNEIDAYQHGRYISSNEAAWRLFKFPIHERFPNVVHLAVHLENGQRVYFNEMNAAQRAIRGSGTTLTAFFELCSNDSFARGLLYVEVPEYYTFQATKIWQARRNGDRVPGHSICRSSTIGRVYTVHPSMSECFYLRTLLMHVRGPRSVKELRTFNGIEYQTYRDACRARGLLDSDEHIISALIEASNMMSAFKLRELFAIIVCHCSPSDPAGLWDRFRDNMSEDFLHADRRRTGNDDLPFLDRHYNSALLHIEELCAKLGKTMQELGLPIPVRETDNGIMSDVNRERNYDSEVMNSYVDENLPKLNNQQRECFDRIISSYRTNRGGIVFIDAPGGTGKTFLINLLLAKIRSEGQIAIAVASSGIAATLLDGGTTAHSMFKLPLNIERIETPTLRIKRGSSKAMLFRECRVIIWDECTMAHKKSLEALDRTLQDLRPVENESRSNRLMGGILVVLAGDFRQTLPIIQRGTAADELRACFKASHLWREVRTVRLTQNMRSYLTGCPRSEQFSSKLLEMGEGRLPHIARPDFIELNEEICTSVANLSELIERVYPDFNDNFSDDVWLFGRAILAPINTTVDEINMTMLDKISSVKRTYLSFDSIADPNEAVNFPIEFLNSLNPSGCPQHKLTLSVGCPIILMRNLNPPKLCNGTRLRVTQLCRNVIEAKIMVGKYSGEYVFIPRVPIIPSDMNFEFTRKQFPVKLAFAMTINKSQGQSIRTVGLHLGQDCFSHGQLYVACSRVGDRNNLFIYANGSRSRNIVYRRALM